MIGTRKWVETMTVFSELFVHALALTTRNAQWVWQHR